MGTLNPLTAVWSRNIAMPVTLRDTGLRCGEVSGLLFENSCIDGNCPKVTGKRNKERVVPIGALDFNLGEKSP